LHRPARVPSVTPQRPLQCKMEAAEAVETVSLSPEAASSPSEARGEPSGELAKTMSQRRNSIDAVEALETKLKSPVPERGKKPAYSLPVRASSHESSPSPNKAAAASSTTGPTGVKLFAEGPQVESTATPVSQPLLYIYFNVSSNSTICCVSWATPSSSQSARQF
jgi:hypothetical protein